MWLFLLFLGVIATAHYSGTSSSLIPLNVVGQGAQRVLPAPEKTPVPRGSSWVFFPPPSPQGLSQVKVNVLAGTSSRDNSDLTKGQRPQTRQSKRILESPGSLYPSPPQKYFDCIHTICLLNEPVFWFTIYTIYTTKSFCLHSLLHYQNKSTNQLTPQRMK